MATKNVRIPAELYDAAEAAGAKLHMPASVAVRYFLQKGIDNTHQNSGRLPENLLMDMENAAKAGGESLTAFLAGLTVQEEQAVKYNIRGMRKIAEEADETAQLAMLPQVKAELDKLCLEGQAVLQNYHDKLPKAVQRELKPVWKEWWRDAGYSDSMYKLQGKRPGARRDPALWARDANHDEAAEAERWEAGTDDAAQPKNNGQVMDSENQQKTTAGRRLCPRTLKYID